MCSEDPAWKRLIGHSLVTDERISLIKTIFSNHNQVQMVANLSGDDAQTFIDVLDEVSVSACLPTKNWSADTHAPCLLGIG